MRKLCLFLAMALAIPAAFAQSNNSKDPTWWEKYQYLVKNGEMTAAGSTTSGAAGADGDGSNECGPQSETHITINTANPKQLAAGSNEIFRDPMRGYWSADGGKTWGGVDLPLPQAIGTNGIRFGSDPTLAFDSRGNLFYGYIVVFFGGGNGINGTEMGGARSTDGGKSYSLANFFSFSGGRDRFNETPTSTGDANLNSPFRDTVYIAWDAA